MEQSKNILYANNVNNYAQNNNATTLEKKKLLNKQLLDDCPGLMLLQHILRTTGIYSHN